MFFLCTHILKNYDAYNRLSYLLLIETPRSKHSDLDLLRNKTAIQYPEYGNGSIFTIRYIQMFSGRPLLANMPMQWGQTHEIDEIMDFSC
jgi:hypothetical protein